MSFKEFKSGSIVIGFICACAILFSFARYMGWLSQNNGMPGTVARTVFGPDVRPETARLQRVRENSPGIPAVTVLCYHEVRPDRDDDCMNVKPEVFRRHIREFKEAGYTFLDVSDLRKPAAGSSLPEKAVLITFDDGYADNYNYAYPILREEQIPATFFVVSGTIGNENRMTAGQLREMQANGMQIGSHTVNHENLAAMSTKDIDFELRASREALEKLLGKPVYALAYPAGKTNRDVLDKAEKYYEIAFLAMVLSDRKQTMHTLQRYGVFNWNEHIESIFRNR